MQKIGILLVMLMFLVGCATSKAQQTTLVSYETGATTLEGMHQTAASMCDAKLMKGSDCNKAVAIYNKTKAANYQVGEVAKIVAKAGDAVQKQVAKCKAEGNKKCDVTNLNLIYQSSVSLYQKVSTDFIKLFNEFMTLAKQFGIVGGTK